MGSTRAPVEAAGDDGLAIDYRELVIDILGIVLVMGGLGVVEGQ